MYKVELREIAIRTVSRNRAPAHLKQGAYASAQPLFVPLKYPTSLSYPAHLRNRGKVEQRTTWLTQVDDALATPETDDYQTQGLSL